MVSGGSKKGEHGLATSEPSLAEAREEVQAEQRADSVDEVPVRDPDSIESCQSARFVFDHDLEP